MGESERSSVSAKIEKSSVPQSFQSSTKSHPAGAGISDFPGDHFFTRSLICKVHTSWASVLSLTPEIFFAYSFSSLGTILVLDFTKLRVALNHIIDTCSGRSKKPI